MDQEANNENEDNATSERNVTFEIPIITTSSPSSIYGRRESNASPIYVNVLKLSPSSIHSDEETDTSFSTTINNNNNTHNGRVSVLHSMSPGNLNASNTSRGVMKIFFLLPQKKQSFCSFFHFLFLSLCLHQNVRRWSQSLTSASKGRPKRTINILPSRLQKCEYWPVFLIAALCQLNIFFLTPL